MIRRRKQAALGRYQEVEAEPSPMEMVANISDVMLVFSVALMVALVARMGVDFSALQLDTSQMEEIEASEVQSNSDESADGSGDLEEVGKVYRDSNGDMYLLGN
jgi:hypothetical protein